MDFTAAPEFESVGITYRVAARRSLTTTLALVLMGVVFLFGNSWTTVFGVAALALAALCGIGLLYNWGLGRLLHIGVVVARVDDDTLFLPMFRGARGRRIPIETIRSIRLMRPLDEPGATSSVAATARTIGLPCLLVGIRDEQRVAVVGGALTRVMYRLQRRGERQVHYGEPGIAELVPFDEATCERLRVALSARGACLE